jgi:flagellar biogenesis protein FliO
MKRNLFSNSLMVLLIFLSLAPVCLAQSAENTTANTQTTEAQGDDENLSFMHTADNPQTQEPSSGGLLLKTLGAMLLIVGLIFFGAWGAKKLGFGGTRSSGSPDEMGLAVLSSVSMGSGRTISTVRFGERILLVGSTTQAFTLLAEEQTGKELSIHNSRSVAEMLAEEGPSFNDEFEQAQNRIELWNDKGENI